MRIAVLGAGIAGSCIALQLASRGISCELFDKHAQPMRGASLHNEGKLHQGYVYAADHTHSTAPLLSRASRDFLSEIEHLARASSGDLHQSLPFRYAVPVDSQKSVAEVATHFARVDCLGNELRSRQLHSSEAAGIFDTKQVLGVFETNEICVDTRQIADTLTSALARASEVTWRALHRLVGVQRRGSGFEVCYSSRGIQDVQYFDAVFNCLWGNRPLFDRMVGMRVPGDWLQRYKLAITLHCVDADIVASVPSTTFIVGPYGDIVNHGDGRFYLSWYPACKLQEARNGPETDPLEDMSREQLEHVFDRTISGLARLLPAAESLRRHRSDACFGGGNIIAWGRSDISDTGSELHQRHRIGVLRDGLWFSVDTGKYCAGPMFARQAVRSFVAELDGA